MRNFDPFTQEYVELSGVASMYELSFSVDSIAAFLALSKLFKFFGLQRNLLILRTVRQSSARTPNRRADQPPASAVHAFGRPCRCRPSGAP